MAPPKYWWNLVNAAGQRCGPICAVTATITDPVNAVPVFREGASTSRAFGETLGDGAWSQSGTGTTTDARTPLVTTAAGLVFSPLTFRMYEGSDASYTVKLATQPTDTVTVTITGTAGTDLSLDKTSLTFTTLNWNVAQPVTVSADEDIDAVHDIVPLTHTASGGDYGSVTKDFEVFVFDLDDAALILTPVPFVIGEGEDLSYTVKLASQPTDTVTVTITGTTGTVLSLDKTSLTFTTLNWNVAQPVMLSAGEDDDARTASVPLTHTASGGDYESVSYSVTVNVRDNDERLRADLVIVPGSMSISEGTEVSLTVNLATQPTDTVTVTITGTTGTDLSLDKTSLTFTTLNWNVAQTVMLSAGEDNDTSNDTVVLTYTASGGDYGSVSTIRDVIVRDNDNITTGLILSPGTMFINEGSATNYTVRLASQPTDTVTVTITGTAGTDLSLDKTSLTFTTLTWNVAQTVRVSAGEDDDAKTDRETLRHTASGGNYTGLNEDLLLGVSDKDTKGLSLSILGTSLVEGDNFSFTVQLRSQPTDTVTVTITGLEGTDLSLDKTSLTFTTMNWNVVQPVMVSAGEDDDTVDDSETLTLGAAGGDYAGQSTRLSLSVIDNDDPPGVALSPHAFVFEEGTSADYKIKLTLQPTDTVTVTITGLEGTDLSLDKTSLTFTTLNWNVAQSVMLSAGEDDDTVDDRKWLDHTASGGGYDMVDNSFLALVFDNDRSVTISTTTLTVAEGGMATYTVVLDGQPTGTVTVTPSRTSGDTDVSVSGALTFTPLNWATPQTVTVTAGQDADGDEDTAVIGHTVGGDNFDGVTAASVDVTVDDDETASTEVILAVDPAWANEATALTRVQLTAELNEAPRSELTTVTVMVGDSGDSAVEGTDYETTGDITLNIRAGQTSTFQTILFRPVNDGTSEGDQSISIEGTTLVPSLTVTGTELTLFDDDLLRRVTLTANPDSVAEDGAPTTVIVNASIETGAYLVDTPVTVTVGDPEDSATAGTDYASVDDLTITISGGATDAVGAFRFMTVNDSFGEGDETISVSGSSTTLGVVVQGTEVTITDDETSSTEIRLSVSPDALGEGAGDTTLAVTGTLNNGPRSLPTSVTVVVGASSDVAVEGTDYETVNDFTLTIDAGQTADTAAFQLIPTDDAIDEVDEALTVSGTTTATGLTVTTSSVTIEDNDTAGVTASTTTLTVDEEDTTGDTYTVVLDTQPTADVVVTVAGHASTDVTPNPAALTFTSTTWSTAQPVTVTAAGDADAVTDTVTLTHSATSTDSDYDGIAIADVAVTVTEVTAPAKPTGLTATGGDGQVALAWDAPAPAAAITHHEYRHKTASEEQYPETWTELADSAPGEAGEAGVTVGSLTNGTTYDFQVRAVNAGGASEPSDAARALAGDGLGICNRTPQVRDAILGRISGITDCAAVTNVHLAAITGVLGLTSKDITALKVGDFAGLTSLTLLALNGNALTTLPAGVFDGLPALEQLFLNSNALTTLPAGVFTGLPALTNLFLSFNELPTLPAGAFTGLTALTDLYLGDNALATLPAGVFDGLTSLTTLGLPNNATLATLPAGVFDDLTALTILDLTGNGLTTLPAGVFARLAALTELSMGGNALATLPAGVFAGLASLTELRLDGNRLTALPAGIFDGLASLATLQLEGNAADPLLLPVTLERTAGARFKAVAPTGAPFGLVLPVSVTNGSIVGGAGTSTIPAGALESSALTVTRSVGASAATTVDIGTVPALPANHSGYGFSKAAGLPLTMPGLTVTPTTLTVAEGGTATYTVVLDTQPTDTVTVTIGGTSGTDVTVADSTLEFTTTDWATAQTVTVRAVVDADVLDDTVTLTHGAASTDSDYDGITIADVAVTVTEVTAPAKPTGLTATGGDEQVALAWDAPATAAVITHHEYRHKTASEEQYPETWTELADSAPGEAGEAGVTVGSLTNGTTYDFQVRAVNAGGASEPSDAARALAGDGLGICNRTPQVRDAILGRISGITDCAAVTNVHLAAITGVLGLTSKDITALKVGDFAGLTSLTLLALNGNALTTLPAGVFDGLPALEQLFLNSNALTTLPAGVFTGLPALTNLFLSFNELPTLPAGAFTGLTALTDLYLGDNALATLPAGVFDGLTSLTTLGLPNNATLATLPAGVFDDLTALTILDLTGNGLTTLPAGVFAGLAALTELSMGGNALATLPAGVFAGLASLTELRLDGNRLTALPAGIFDGLASLATLQLEGNAVDPLLLPVTLERTAGARFKAVAPTGAPFGLVLPVSVTNGSIVGGAGTSTIPAGALESSALTVTRSVGASAATTVDIGTVPALPANHSGYGFSKAAGLPLTMPGLTVTPTTLTVDEEDTTGDTYTVVLDTQPTADVVVTVAGHASTDVTPNPATLTFTSTTWSTAQAVTVTAGGDADTTDDTVTLTHGAASTDSDYDGITIADVAVTVTDNDAVVTIAADAPSALYAGGSADFTLTRTGAVARPLAVPVTLTQSQDYLAAANLSRTVVFLVDSVTAALQVPASQFRQLAAGTTPEKGTLTATVAAGTGYGVGAADSAAVDILIAATIGITEAAYTVSEEGGSPLTVTVVVRTGDGAPRPTGTISVSMGTFATGSATTPEDYQTRSEILRFSPSDFTAEGTVYVAEKSLEITINDDSVADSGETFEIRLEGAPGLPIRYWWNFVTAAGHRCGSTCAVTATIEDDDTAGVTVTPTTLSVDEGGTATYTVVLDTQPTDTVTVTIGGAAGTDVSVADSTLEFTTTDWATAQTVTVRAVADADALDDTVTLTHGAASTDSDYDGIAIADVAVTVTEVTAPAKPTGLTATGGDGQVALAWDAPAATAVITHHEYRHKTASEEQYPETWTELADSAPGEAGEAGVTVGSLTNGTTYDFQVRAVNAGGASEPSDAARALAGDGLGICNRTPQVRDAILGRISGITDCAAVTNVHLAAITGVLGLTSKDITALKVGDFAGLTSLTLLALNGNALTTLPAGVFDGLPALEQLFLNSNALTTLPAGVFTGLPALTNLFLSFNELPTLPAGAFTGLTALTDLYLGDNALATLPAGVFDGLTSLTTLGLPNNATLATLPAGVFDDLTALTILDLTGNGLTTLPAGVFARLAALTELSMGGNALATLPAGVFAGLASLTELRLDGNRLTALPAGIFDGLASLATLQLEGNAADPLLLPVTLERTAGARFKAVAPTGAPFGLVLPVSVTNGSIVGGAGTSTIPAGALESSALTVTRAVGASAATTVDIGTVPALPANHSGYGFSKAAGLPLTMPGLTVTPTTLTVDEEDTTGDTYTVVLDTQPTADVVVTVAGHASTDVTPNPATLTFTSTTWSTAQAVTVTAGGDADTTDDTVTLTHGAASTDSDYDGITIADVAVTVTDNDAVVTIAADAPSALYAGGSADFTLTRTGAVARPLAVTVTLTQSQDYLAAANLSRTVVFLVDSVTAALQVPASQFRQLAAGTTPEKGTLTATVAAGTDYDVGAADSAAVDILIAATIGIKEASYTVSEEGGSPLTVTVVARTGDGAPRPTGTISVSMGTFATGSATTPEDYQTRSEILRFSPSDFTAEGTVYVAEKSLEITINDDSVADSGETFEIRLEGAPGLPIRYWWNFVTAAGHRCGSTCAVTATIEDDDTAGVTVTPTTLSVAEGGTATYTVVLDTQPTDTVTVTIGGAAGTDVSVADSTLEFTTTDWATAQTVTVSAVADADVLDDTVTLTHSATSTDSDYDGITIADVAVTVTEVPAPAKPTGLTATGGDGQVALAWDAPAPAAVITHHEYRHKTASEEQYPETWTELADSAPGEAGEAGVTVGSLTNGTTYDFQVRAVNAGGASEPSDAARALAGDGLGICNRTPQVRDAILGRISGITDCAAVTNVHLAAITGVLGLTSKDITALKVGDFAGLTSLTLLALNGNALTTLPAGVFDGLPALEQLFLNSNALTTLPAGVFTGLPALTNLFLSFNELPTLPAGAFTGLTALTDLYLGDNALATLPAGVFDGLTSLTTLGLPNNATLATLPAGVFDDLTALTILDLTGNGLTTLPAGVFAGLAALTELSMGGNALATLPAGVFAGLASLTELRLDGNRLTALPAGIFDGLASLATLQLEGNAADPLLLPVTLERTAGARFKAVAPTGAPFGLVLPVSVTNGSIVGGAGTSTIPAGALESSALTVTRSAAASAATTVDIGTVPALPSGHSGYGFSKAAGLPLTMPGLTVTPTTLSVAEGGTATYTVVLDTQPTDTVTVTIGGTAGTDVSVADSTLEFTTTDWATAQTVTVRAVVDADVLDDTVTLTHGAASTDSDYDGITIADVAVTVTEVTAPAKPTGLTATGGDEQVALAWDAPAATAVITHHEYRHKTASEEQYPETWTELADSAPGEAGEAGVTVGSLTNGTTYDFQVRAVNAGGASEPSDAARALAGDGLGICNRTPQVRDAILGRISGITDCAAVTNVHLAAITGVLGLTSKDITALKVGDFAGLTSVTLLALNGNALTTLPAGVFDGLPALEQLFLNSNALTTLPAGVFTGLPALTNLFLSFNELPTLPAGAFTGLTALTDLYLGDNALATLPAGVFDGLTSLTTLGLPNNATLATLPAGVFDDLTALTILDLTGNGLTTLPAGVFARLAALTELSMGGNALATLPAGVFAGLASLTELRLDGNRLTALPAGIFDGLASLATLQLEGNAADPLLLPVTLERTAGARFKAVAPTGAPFGLVLPVSVTNGSIVGGAGTSTIPAGALESSALTVTRAVGASAATTVDIGTVPALPANHSGYGFSKAAGLPLTMPGLTVTPTTLTVDEEDTTGDTYTVVLDTQPTADVVVTVAGHASTDVTPNPATLTFTSTTWSTAQPVTVTAGGDADTTDDTVTLTHGAASTDSDYDGITIADVAVTVTDNDAVVTIAADAPSALYAGGSADFTLTRTGAVARPLAVTVTLTQSQDYLAAANLSRTVVFLVDSVTAALQVPASQFRQLAAGTTPEKGTLTATVAAGTDYDVGAADSAAVDILIAATIGIKEASYTVSEEGGSPLTVTVVARTGDGAPRPTGTISVSMGTFATGSATTPEDYQTRSEILRFSPSDFTAEGTVYVAEKSLEITINDDSVADSGETFEIRLEGAPGLPIRYWWNFVTAAGHRCGSTCAVTATIEDDDTAGVTVTPTTLSVAEGGTATYTVVLDTQPTDTVTVTIGGAAGTDVSVADSTLEFTTTDWATAQTVTVRAVADADALDDTVTLTHGAASTDSDYDGIAIADVAVTVTEVTAPAKPTGLTATGGDGQVALAWDAPAATAVITHHEYRHKTASEEQYPETWTELADSAPGEAGEAGVTVGSLTNGTTYDFQVRAVNAGGASEPSDAARALAGDGLGICNRTPQVRDAILGRISGITDCAAVTNVHLAAITGVLGLTSKDITALKVGDFAGLTSLTLLALNGNALTTLPAGVFDGLPALEQLFLNSNALTTLPAGVFTGLPALTNLFLSFNELPTLPAGAFTGLTALTDLYLGDNALATLPAGVFDGLTSLTTLGLPNNATLATLPAGVFDDLTALTILDLTGNGLTTLPAGVFAGLAALTELSMGGNALATLPAGVFAGLASLTELRLDGNRLTALPAGIFDGLASLATLQLEGNAVDPLLLPVTLERTAGARFKAVAPTGAPFGLVLPVSVTNGSIVGGAGTSTIPAGALESSALTVTRAVGASAATTVDIGTVPALPANHSGYGFSKAAGLPLTMPGLTVTPTTLTVDEEDATGDSYTVVLSTPPNATVTVTIGGTSGTDVTVDDSTLEFTTTDWATAQTVTVSAAADADTLNDTVTLTHGAASTDSDYDGITIADVAVTVTDNDAVVTIAADAPSALYAEGSADFTLTRTGAVARPLAVTVTLTQSQDYLAAAHLSRTVVFLVDSVTAALQVPASQFRQLASGTVPEKGTLTATVAAGTDYDVGAADSAAVDIAIAGTIGIKEASYTVSEERGSPLTVTVVARTGDGAPQPTGTIFVTLGTFATGSATSPEDYQVRSEILRFNPSDFTAEGTVYVAEKSVEITINDDSVADSGETFEIRLQDAPGLLIKYLYNFVNTAGQRCGPTCAVTATITDTDANAVTVTPTTLEVAEGGTATYTVVLDAQPADTVTVTIGGAAGTDVSVADSTLEFTTVNWSTAQTVTVTAAEDADAADDTVTLTHTAGGGGYDGVAVDSVAVTVADNDELELTASFSPVEAMVPEGDTVEVTLRITASRPPSGVIRFRASTQGGTATSVDDYAPVLPRIQEALSTEFVSQSDGTYVYERIFELRTVEDTEVEGDETFFFDITAPVDPSGATYVSRVEGDEDGVRVTIEDDDNAAPTFRDGSSTSRAFGETLGDTAAAAADIGAPVAATDTDAGDTLAYSLAGADAARFGIGAASGQLRTRAGERYDYEATASYAVTVTVVDGRGGSDTIAVTLNVTDRNEAPLAPAAPGVTETPGSTTSLDVNWTAPPNTGRPAIASYDVRYREGSTGPFTDGPEDVTGTSASISGLAENTAHEVQVRATNAEGDGAWSQSGTGTTSAPANAAPVFRDGSSTSRAFVETLGGAAETTASNIGVPVAAEDADMDTLAYSLAGADAASFGIVAASGQLRTRAGERYDYEATASYAVTVTVVDGRGGSDTIAVTLNVTDRNEAPLAPAAPGVTETPGSTTSLDVNWAAPPNTGRPPVASYDVRYREGSTGPFTDGPEDVTGTIASISGLAEHTAYEVQVRATNAEGDGAWSQSGTGTTSAPANVSVTVTRTRLTVDEGGTATYTVVLDAQPTGGTVTVTVGGTTGTDVSVDDATLEFTTTDWSTAQTVTVSAAEDADAVNDTVTLTHTPSGGGFDGVAVASVAVTVADNERGVTVTPTTLEVVEGGDEISYTVVLDSRPTGTVVVARSVYGGQYVTVLPKLLRFTTENWSTAQTVTVRAVVDHYPWNESVTVKHAANGGGYGGVRVDDVALTVLDRTRGVIVTPTTLTVTAGDTATYTVKLKSQPWYGLPKGIVTVTVGGASGDVSVEPTRLKFLPAEWNKPQTVTVRAGAGAAGAVTLTHTPSGGGYGGVVGDSVEVTVAAGDDDADTVTDTDSLTHGAASDRAFEGEAEALAAVAGLGVEAVAGVLLGEADLSAVQRAALDYLGNRNGSYDLGDVLSWTERCRRGSADCGGRDPSPDSGALPANRRGGKKGSRRRRASRSRRAGDGRRRGGRPPERRARRRRAWGVPAALGAVLATSACGIGNDLTQPSGEAPARAEAVQGSLRVTLRMPTASRATGVFLAVEGPAIDSLRAPGLELLQWEVPQSTRRHVIIAGRPLAGPILEVFAPPGSDPADYRVEVLQITGPEYELRDPRGYSAIVSRPSRDAPSTGRR
ncbi:fibronectin type III domain-containing protein [Candidatus Palauibacter sp.]|uniref:fibronectin type III domain-containing protein n=1 Tax=Candidatus Palauibacter sp. TaxID=3101350 RepID=UPI003B515599